MLSGSPSARAASQQPESGFTLIEVLLALVLIAIGLLAAAPMFVYGAKVRAASGDIGILGSGAVMKLESFRRAKFGSLAAGGSLSSDVSGYFDTSDPAFTLRWTIGDDATPARKKTITMVAIATRVTSMGPRKILTLSTMRAR
jgi:prepilin-type N-terminal cleavage/methylation domain-containing protein